MNAYEIADKVFNNNFNDNITIQLDYNDDIKIFFEMCVIITTEGFKKFYSDINSNTVNIELLTIKHLENINQYLKKINIKLIFRKFTQYQWHNEKISENYISYKDKVVNKDTLLEELYFIIIRTHIFVISFTHIRV